MDEELYDTLMAVLIVFSSMILANVILLTLASF